MTRRLSGIVIRDRPGEPGCRMRLGAGVPPGQQRHAGRRPRSGGGVLPHRGSGVARQSQLQDRARTRDARRLARAFRQGASVRGAGSARSGARRVPAGERVRPDQPQAAAKVVALDQTIRERIEAARPRPAIEQLRERARAASAPPMLNPASREPLIVRFNAASLRDILNSIGNLTGINITYDRDVPGSGSHGRPRRRDARAGACAADDDEPAVVQGAQRALDLRLPGHAAEARAVRRSGDPDVLRLPRRRDGTVSAAQQHHPPAAASACSRSSSSTRRPTRSPCAPRPPVVQIIEKVIAQNDKPRAEIVIDVEILEVNRTRAKQYGLNLSEYALGVVLSPEVSPSSATTQTPGTGTGAGNGTTTANTGQSTPPSGLTSPPPFNVNTISQGLSTSDFYLAVPTAIVRFLETDTNTKLVAKPQLRGRRRVEAVAEPGRPHSGDFDQLHAARDRRRRRQPAELVHLSGHRREHRHDAGQGDARRTTSSST